MNSEHCCGTSPPASVAWRASTSNPIPTMFPAPRDGYKIPEHCTELAVIVPN
jgi:hypothetical protein